MSERTGHVVGYVRVSSADQHLDRQLDAMGDVDKLFTETASARDRRGRPVLAEALSYVREGDTLRVKSPDRLARSTEDLLAIVRELRERGVAVEFIEQPALNTESTSGEFMLTILGAVAQMERAIMRERQAEGIAAAKRRGKYARAPKLTDEQIATARARVADGVPKAKVARDLGVSRTMLHHALSGQGVYSPHHPGRGPSKLPGVIEDHLPAS